MEQIECIMSIGKIYILFRKLEQEFYELDKPGPILSYTRFDIQ